jgi:hypothetical protein
MAFPTIEQAQGSNDTSLWVVTRTWPLESRGQGVQRMHKPVIIPFLGAVSMLATAVSTFAISTYPQIVQAQTPGHGAAR